MLYKNILKISLVEGNPLGTIAHRKTPWFGDQGIQVIQWHPSSLHMNLIVSILAHVMREFSHNDPTAVRELQVRDHQSGMKIPKASLQQ